MLITWSRTSPMPIQSGQELRSQASRSARVMRKLERVMKTATGSQAAQKRALKKMAWESDHPEKYTPAATRAAPRALRSRSQMSKPSRRTGPHIMAKPVGLPFMRLCQRYGRACPAMAAPQINQGCPGNQRRSQSTVQPRPMARLRRTVRFMPTAWPPRTCPTP